MMTPNEDGPSARDFERLSRVVERLTLTLEDLPLRMEKIYVRQDVYHAEQKAQDKEIEGLNSIWNWGIRIVLGAVILAVLGVVISQTGVP